MLKITETSEFIIAKNHDNDFKNKIAVFDLDNTIIKTKSGKKFPQSEFDWIFTFSNVKKKLKKLEKKGYFIIIVTNQNGIENGKQNKDEFLKKINDIVIELNIKICVFCATKINKYRKPSPLFYYEFIYNINIDVLNSFYCGDACNRKNDFSDTDYKFALNCYLPFQTPEYFFINKKDIINDPIYPNVLSYKNVLPIDKILNFKPLKNDMILMVGFPASGKSTIAKYISDTYDYSIINQDTLKTKAKCIKMAKEYMKENKNFIIDATNPIRDEWINMAHPLYNISIIYLTTSYDLSMHNNYYRTFTSSAKLIPKIAYNVYKSKFIHPQNDKLINRLICVDYFHNNTKLLYYKYLY
jgi:bifunctional polynucleotide phosphatase/kinase